MTVFTAPVMIEGLSIAGNNVARNSAVGLVAIGGLLGYAFGFRLGPLLFWRFLAVVFSAGLMVRAGPDVAAAAMAASYGLHAAFDAGKLAAAAIWAAATLLWCLSLLRQAELVRPNKDSRRRKDGDLVEIFS